MFLFLNLTVVVAVITPLVHSTEMARTATTKGRGRGREGGTGAIKDASKYCSHLQHEGKHKQTKQQPVWVGREAKQTSKFETKVAHSPVVCVTDSDIDTQTSDTGNIRAQKQVHIR